jgi:hypothetical protein
VLFFCENREERRRGKGKKDPEKKKAFAFFHIKILFSFFPFFLHTAKVSRPSYDFHVGVAAEKSWWFSVKNKADDWHLLINGAVNVSPACLFLQLTVR